MATYRDGKLVPDLVILKGIPIPPVAVRPGKVGTSFAEAARKMEVGDCITIPYERNGSHTTYMAAATGYKFTQRTITIDGERMMRIWRIN